MELAHRCVNLLAALLGKVAGEAGRMGYGAPSPTAEALHDHHRELPSEAPDSPGHLLKSEKGFALPSQRVDSEWYELHLHMQMQMQMPIVPVKLGGFDWDSGNLSNCLSHGVSLAEIEALFAGDVYVVRDTIMAGERRTLVFGNGDGRWIFCVFTWRGGRIRPVSVRFMHAKEVKRYAEKVSRLEDR